MRAGWWNCAMRCGDSRRRSASIVRWRAATATLLLAAVSASAQARRITAPSEPSLLNLTAGWARASVLGDLRDARAGGDFIELRVWHGYAAAETQATILRRTQGHWSALFARVIRCEMQLPRGVADTASAATMRGFAIEARRHCGQSVTDVAPGSRVIAADTLVVQPLEVAEAKIAAAWNEAVASGALDLPVRVHRDAAPDEGRVFVIELRRGEDYRASEIEDVDAMATSVDAQIKRIYAALRRLRADSTAGTVRGTR